MNEIILSSDFEKTKAEILASKGLVRIFENSEILLEDAAEAKREAYIAESELKTIVLIGQKFRVEAQNSLLLILEDSPKNVEFILVSERKSSFLATIRSRMAIKNEIKREKLPKTNLNLRNLSLKDIDEFLKEKTTLERSGELDKFELEILVRSIVKESLEAGVRFNSLELDYIKKLYTLTTLNTKARGVLTPLLLMISQK